MHGPLPANGQIEMRGRLANVYDKGQAALLEIEVSSSVFSATYNIFLPGRGGFGGERGAAAAPRETIELVSETAFETDPDLAALYRLTGDRHPVHIDPAVAAANGFSRPILHGLCTLGIAARIVAGHVGAHPADLAKLEVRLAAPVLPGDTLVVMSGERDGLVAFEARVGEKTVLKSGKACFA
jgi:acyl dehydratase